MVATALRIGAVTATRAVVRARARARTCAAAVAAAPHAQTHQHPPITTTTIITNRRGFAATAHARAEQGYGDAEGKPAGGGKNPQERPRASAAQESLEHPGPEPPDVGKGTGAGPTKAAFAATLDKVASDEASSSSSSSSPEETASAQSGGSRSKEAVETGRSPTGGGLPDANPDSSTARTASQGGGGEGLKGPQGRDKPRPRIHNQSVPGVREGLSEEQKQEVEKHNRDFEKRYDRGSEAPDDKVDKKFWSGR